MKLALIIIVGGFVYVIVAVAVERYVPSRHWYFAGVLYGLLLASAMNVILLT